MSIRARVEDKEASRLTIPDESSARGSNVPFESPRSNLYSPIAREIIRRMNLHARAQRERTAQRVSTRDRGFGSDDDDDDNEILDSPRRYPRSYIRDLVRGMHDELRFAGDDEQIFGHSHQSSVSIDHDLFRGVQDEGPPCADAAWDIDQALGPSPRNTSFVTPDLFGNTLARPLVIAGASLENCQMEGHTSSGV